jgi:hypothetical protein
MVKDEINEKVAAYETHLRDAERSVEKALQAICPLTGEEVSNARMDVSYKVLEGIQNAIRGTWKLYEDPLDNR